MGVPHNIELIVVGGSAGALDALGSILPALPRQFLLPLVMVVHLPPAKSSVMASVIGAKCVLPVKEPDDKEPIASGTLYIAPPNYHLLIERQRTLSLSVDDVVLFSRPSIDVLFESAAEAYGAAVAGLLLTGANEDGARGLARIKQAGGLTIVQSPKDAVAPAMPNAALKLATPDHVLPLHDIGPFLTQLGGSASRQEKVP